MIFKRCSLTCSSSRAIPAPKNMAHPSLAGLQLPERALRAPAPEGFCSLATSAVSSDTSPCSSTLSRVRGAAFPNDSGGCLWVTR